MYRRSGSRRCWTASTIFPNSEASVVQKGRDPGIPVSSVSSERLTEATLLSQRAPLPAVVGNVLTGTAGWTDPTLMKSGLFYPRHVKSAQGKLTFYGEHFGLVEVDATYYSLLPPEMSERWASWTQPGFRFDVKAFPILTGHPLDINRLPRELQSELMQTGFSGRTYPDRLPREWVERLELGFRATLEPLVRTGKLTSVLLQFPPWFVANRGNTRRIEAIRESWPETPFSVEFRHPSWIEEGRRDRVFDLLRRLELSYVCVDEPEGEVGAVPPVAAVTNPRLAVLRLHGQNRAGWRRGATVRERFDYLYSPAELARWVEPVARLRGEAEEVHVVFNNCVRNYAVLNAKGFAALLGATG